MLSSHHYVNKSEDDEVPLMKHRQLIQTLCLTCCFGSFEVCKEPERSSHVQTRLYDELQDDVRGGGG